MEEQAWRLSIVSRTGGCQASRPCCSHPLHSRKSNDVMDRVVRRIDLARTRGEDARRLLRQEWLVTNGLGGYASGTISGEVTWRYHGLLIAALPAPFGRRVMLNHLAEFIARPDGQLLAIGGEESSHPEEAMRPGHYVTEFRIENGLPVWRYQVDSVVLEKHVLFLHGQNTVHVNYRLESGAAVQMRLRPSVHFRGHGQEVNEGSMEGYELLASANQYEVACEGLLPRLRMVLEGEPGTFTYDGGIRREI